MKKNTRHSANVIWTVIKRMGGGNDTLALQYFSSLHEGKRERDVAFKVLYCGICHSDLRMLKNDWGISTYPLLPGHEIVGIVTEVGSKVEKFKVGDRVGVGCMVGSCKSCQSCSDNLENYCPKMILTYGSKYVDGSTTYGGYSDWMVAEEHFMIRIPEALPLDAAAPLLCAGITVYSPLRYIGLDKPGLQVGGVGLGGLGHLAVKFAKAFGAKVTVISTSPNKKKKSIEHLGADSFVVSTEPVQMKAVLGSFDGIIDTVSATHPLLPLLGLLKSHGKLIMLGAPEKPLELPVFALLMGRKTMAGSTFGGIKETQEMIDFASEHNVKPEIPMDYVNTGASSQNICQISICYQCCQHLEASKLSLVLHNYFRFHKMVYNNLLKVD